LAVMDRLYRLLPHLVPLSYSQSAIRHRFVSFFFFHCSLDLRDLHSFPTRRSSDLAAYFHVFVNITAFMYKIVHLKILLPNLHWKDRKSTRLNSSHVSISYAVFCLKKKKQSNSSPIDYASSRAESITVPSHTKKTHT